MELNLKLTKEGHIAHYIQLFADGLELTKKEQLILKLLLLYRSKLIEDNVPENYADSIVFKEASSILKSELGLTNQGFFNYKEALIKKKALYYEDNDLRFHRLIIPVKTLTINFTIHE